MTLGPDATPAQPRRRGRLSRRQFLGAAGAGAAGVATAGVLASRADHDSSVDLDGAEPFFGAHQAGIVTPAQDRLHFVSFDVLTDDRDDLVDLLQRWTQAAARMTQGADAGPVGAVSGHPEAPPDDTGEAIGLPSSRLTLTVGFGPTLFTSGEGVDRFGIAARRPDALAEIPHFIGDALDATISGGDLCVQACANDPQVAVHAIRNLARIGMGVVSVRWSQLGFGRTSSTSRTQDTPRNMLGFKDGTANLKAEDADELREHLWVASGDGPDWMAGGSYVVTRKIRMHIETWDRERLAGQEEIIGRTKGEGAPLGKTDEFDDPDLGAMDDNAHVRLAHPSQHGGAKLLRRGYNFVDGSDGLGRLDAGLFFIAYQRDPRTQFVPVQAALASSDLLNEYLKHVSSAVFAVPPGVGDADDMWGRALFA